jgi:two-component sensor histidine kinase
MLQAMPEPLRAAQLHRWAAYTPANPRGEVEHRVQGPDGPMCLAWTEHALFDTEGRLTEIQAVARDVTAARQAQEQIRQMNADLERRVADRTADLAMVNDSLLAEIAERQHAQAQITASLKEKELLLKEIHHRVKNNLQVIASLLSLQAAGPVDPAAREMLRESQNRVRSMALIHEELYRGGDLARVAFGRYLSGLTAQLVRTYRTVSHSAELTLEVDDGVVIDLDRAIPCGLVVNELVTNALKYAFPNGRRGHLLVSLAHYPGSLLRLTVADDGPGLPPGLDWRNTETLGLQLVTTLADQLGGAVTLDQTRGTAFSVIFPATGAPVSEVIP